MSILKEKCHVKLARGVGLLQNTQLKSLKLLLSNTIAKKLVMFVVLLTFAVEEWQG